LAHSVDQSDLLYWSNLPAEKVGVNRHFKAAEPHGLADAHVLV